MHQIGMFDRKGPLTVEGFQNSGADWMPQYKPYIADGITVIASPHKPPDDSKCRPDHGRSKGRSQRSHG